MSPSGVKCFKCGAELNFPPGTRVGRAESCSSCRSEVRVCYNCVHYDKSSYNECREPMAERVLDKDRSNFCDYFSLRAGGESSLKIDAKAEALKKLDALFKPKS